VIFPDVLVLFGYLRHVVVIYSLVQQRGHLETRVTSGVRQELQTDKLQRQSICDVMQDTSDWTFKVDSNTSHVFSLTHHSLILHEYLSITTTDVVFFNLSF